MGLEVRRITWTFGDRLRKVRREMGVTSRELAALLGVTNSSVAQWETDRVYPRHARGIAYQVQELSDVSGVWLLTGDDSKWAQRLPAPEVITQEE